MIRNEDRCRGRRKKVLAMIIITESDRTKREEGADVGGRKEGKRERERERERDGEVLFILLIFGGK